MQSGRWPPLLPFVRSGRRRCLDADASFRGEAALSSSWAAVGAPIAITRQRKRSSDLTGERSNALADAHLVPA
jgi:hypothetical protein